MKKFVGMASVFNTFLDSLKPSSMDKSEMITVHMIISLDLPALTSLDTY